MNILVCVKQVPNTDKIRINPETNTLIRDGVENMLNTYDGYALEAAARIKDKHPDTLICALSMGPPHAEAVLRECLSVAADKAYLVTDRAFGGSDTLATGYVLSEAVAKIEESENIKFDMVFCGKQATDGDTAQVGPELAEYLGCPQVTCALTVEYRDGRLTAAKETDGGRQVIGVRPPCLVTFTKPSFDLRFPTYKRKKMMRDINIIRMTAGDFHDLDLNRAGLRGSPTKVKRTFVPPVRKRGIMISGESGSEIANGLLDLLFKDRIL